MPLNNSMLPNAKDLEDSLIVSILLSEEIAELAIDRIKPEHFYTDRGRSVMEAVLKLKSDNAPVSLAAIADAIRLMGKNDSVGGAAGLSAMIDSIPGVASYNQAEYAIERIIETATNRNLIVELSKALNESTTRTSAENIALLDKIRSKVEEQSPSLSTMKSLSELTGDWAEKWEKDPSGLSTGFCGLDALTGGFIAPDLTILAARPSVGKTALATNIAKNIAGNGDPVAFFSFEMPHDQLGARLVSMTSELNTMAFRYKNGLQQRHWREKITPALSYLHSLPIYIETRPYRQYQNVIRAIKHGVKAYGIELAIIDYLGLMEGDRRQNRKDLELAAITAELKNLAIFLNIPILLLSQMNRKIEERNDKLPILSDLKDTGASEQDADVVLMLYRLTDEQNNDIDGVINVSVEKNRHGPTGTVTLAYESQFTLFSDYEPCG
jgi:replicative DNA helicase